MRGLILLALSFFLSLVRATPAPFSFPLLRSSGLPIQGNLTEIHDFVNPTNAGFFIYVPVNLAPKPAVVVALHFCGGSGQWYFYVTPYVTLAEQYGFIVVYPSSPVIFGCWDVSSKASLTHNGGGDSNSIANMVRWTLDHYPAADPSKVYLLGTSSGAMMTNVLAATYPEVFSAAVVYSGVPAGCFMSTTNAVAAWNWTCSLGESTNTPQGWASVVEDMYPGYSGPRPKMLIYHGGTDTVIAPRSYVETIKQWSGVFGYNYTAPLNQTNNVPSLGYVEAVWGPNLMGSYSPDVPHPVPNFGVKDMAWFNLTMLPNAVAAPPTPLTVVYGGAPPSTFGLPPGAAGASPAQVPP